MLTVLDEASRGQAERIGALKAKAAEHSQSGNHLGCADAHMQRAEIHSKGKEDAEAADAYKAACDAYQAHLKAKSEETETAEAAETDGKK